MEMCSKLLQMSGLADKHITRQRSGNETRETGVVSGEFSLTGESGDGKEKFIEPCSSHRRFHLSPLTL